MTTTIFADGNPGELDLEEQGSSNGGDSDGGHHNHQKNKEEALEIYKSVVTTITTERVEGGDRGRGGNGSR